MVRDMSNPDLTEATAAAGAAIEQAVAVFMLHPQTYGASVAAGYRADPERQGFRKLMRYDQLLSGETGSA